MGCDPKEYKHSSAEEGWLEKSLDEQTWMTVNVLEGMYKCIYPIICMICLMKW